MPTEPPTIFSQRRRLVRRGHRRSHGRTDVATFVLDEMIDDMLERLAFLRLEPQRPEVIGDYSFRIARQIDPDGIAEADIIGYFDHPALDLEQPHPWTGFDFIGVLGLLDTVNDLPGALIHLHNALAPGGFVIASFVGGNSLPKLRRAMLEAEPDRPAARMHPLVDPRAAPQLLQRAGWADPVVDTFRLTARYSSLDRLVQDLREQALGNVLASPAPPLTRTTLDRARAAFLAQADPDGKVSETFEIVTLTGRRSRHGT